MKVKVIECDSFEEFLNSMHGNSDMIVGKVIDANSSNPTKATEKSVKDKKKKKKKIPKCIEAYIRILGQKHHLSFEAMRNFLAEVWEVSKTATYNMLAKQIAITIDKAKYEDHISNSDKLFVINLYDGNVYECKAAIKNLELIPVFRTEEDAELAKSILKPMLDEMFR